MYLKSMVVAISHYDFIIPRCDSIIFTIILTTALYNIEIAKSVAKVVFRLFTKSVLNLDS